MLRDIVVLFLLACGLFFFFVGSVGLVRMPDVFCRIHATTKCDTLGAGLILLALIVWQGFGFTSINIAIVLMFIWLTNPTACHSIARSQYTLQTLKNKESAKEA